MKNSDSAQETPGSAPGAVRRRASGIPVFAGTGIALAVLALDQVSKVLAGHFLSDGHSIVLIPGVLELRYALNPGAAWGMLSGCSWLLLLIGIAAIVLSLRYLNVIVEGSRVRGVAVFMVLGGIVGNSIDRIWLGQVVDFISVDLQFYKWPIFNIADSAICIGVCLYLISTLFGGRVNAEKSEKNLRES